MQIICKDNLLFLKGQLISNVLKDVCRKTKNSPQVMKNEPFCFLWMYAIEIVYGKCVLLSFLSKKIVAIIGVREDKIFFGGGGSRIFSPNSEFFANFLLRSPPRSPNFFDPNFLLTSSNPHQRRNLLLFLARLSPEFKRLLHQNCSTHLQLGGSFPLCASGP